MAGPGKCFQANRLLVLIASLVQPYPDSAMAIATSAAAGTPYRSSAVVRVRKDGVNVRPMLLRKPPTWNVQPGWWRGLLISWTTGSETQGIFRSGSWSHGT
jgi:hypothetical protein